MPRKPTSTPVAQEEEISAELLDQIPDLPDIHATSAMEAEPREGLLGPGDASPTLHAIVAQMQAEMEQVMSAELSRIETSMSGAFAQLEAKLAQTEAELASLRDTNATLVHAKDRYDRAIQAIKELTQDVGETA
jgi:hypothetical protein